MGPCGSGRTLLFYFTFTWGTLGTYAVHFRLIGKRVVDFLFVLIELFSLDVTAEALRANISVFEGVGQLSVTLVPRAFY